MAWADTPPENPKKPSRVLGFLLGTVVVTATIFSLAEIAGHHQFILDCPPADLDKGQWVVLIGVVAAIAGWIISAIVTMRNSIRQHTVSTLLSSRLSETYMTQTRRVNTRYFRPDRALYQLQQQEIDTSDPAAELAALRYLLNYYEFIAVGIRYGDLDETLLKNTLRGILCGVYEAAGPLVHEPPLSKSTGSRTYELFTRPKTYEHLKWLYKRWHIPALQLKVEPRPPEPATAGTNPAPVTVQPDRKVIPYWRRHRLP